MNSGFTEDPYAQYWIKDGVIYMRYLVKVLDLQAAKETVHKRMETFKGIPLVLVDIRELKHVTREVRQYLSGEEAQVDLKAAALISDSRVTRLMFDFFVNFDKPSIPLKMFAGEQEALKWLKQYK
jgi:hypothetical protein